MKRSVPGFSLAVSLVALVVGAFLLIGSGSVARESLGFNGTLAPATASPRASATPSFAKTCDPKPEVPGGGPYLTCQSAIAFAVATLPAGHPEVEAAASHYDCPQGSDCAVWLFGSVDLHFAGSTP